MPLNSVNREKRIQWGTRCKEACRTQRNAIATEAAAATQAVVARAVGAAVAPAAAVKVPICILSVGRCAIRSSKSLITMTLLTASLDSAYLKNSCFYSVCYAHADTEFRGSFSSVYLGIDLETEEKVAIKVVKLRGCSKPESIRNEIDILLQVQHENVISCLDLFETDACMYIVMELYV